MEKDPIKEAKDEYFEIKKIINQQMQKTNPKKIFKLKSIPI